MTKSETIDYLISKIESEREENKCNAWRKFLAWFGLISLITTPLLLLEIHYLLGVIHWFAN